MRLKRSSLRYEIHPEPVLLPEDFPIIQAEQQAHDDRPITRLHVHPCLELGVCHQGAGIFVIGGKVARFSTGTVAVIAEGEPHYAQSTPGTTSAWTWFWLDPEGLLAGRVPAAMLPDRRGWTSADFANLTEPGGADDAGPLLLALRGELQARGTGWRDAVAALVLAVWVRTSRRAPADGGEAARAPTRFERIGPALDFMARHHAEPMSMPALARRCGLSPAQFRRVFTSATGQAPLAYLLNLRVQAVAAELRGRKRTITEAAFAHGFESLSGFQRAFRRVLGCNPREWRGAKTRATVAS